MLKRRTLILIPILITFTLLTGASFGQIEFEQEDIDPDDLEQCADAYDHEGDGTADGEREIGCTYPLWNAEYEGNTWSTTVKERTMFVESAPNSSENPIQDNNAPQSSYIVFPSISLRGNETIIRDSGSEEMSGLNHGISFDGGSGLWTSGEGSQTITKPEELSPEWAGYASHNLTQNNEEIEVYPYTYILDVEYTDSVEETTTNFDEDTKQLPSTTIQKPLRRPIAQEETTQDKTIDTSTLVYPPHYIEGAYPEEEQVRRGNGLLDDNSENDKIDNNEFGHEAEHGEEHHGERIEWHSDYGRPLEKHAIDGEYVDVPLNQEGYRCLDDDASCNSGSSTCGGGCDTDKPEGGSCERFDGGGDSFSDCEDNDNLLVDTSNEYYEELNKFEYRGRDCGTDGSVTSCSGASSDNCNKKSSNESCSFQSSSYGTAYEWDNKPKNCHQAHSQVDGGSDVVGNSPAATYTQFVVQQDEDWTPRSYSNEDYNDGGSIWCGWEPSETITINADGPNGRGNGWIVVDESEGDGEERIVARQGPLGDNKVGRNVYYRTGEEMVDEGSDAELERHEEDFIESAFDGQIECGSGREICAKFLSFNTQEDGWEWAGSIENTIDFAIDTQGAVIHSFTPDDSYGACKLINRVYNQDPDNNQDAEIITCDYKTTTDQREHISGPEGMGENAISASPLPQACGDRPDEHVFTMAGPEIDHDRMVGNGYTHGYLNHHQKCLEIGEDETQNELRGNNLVDENSCLNKGNAYQEGTVKPVRRHRPDLDYDNFDDDDLKGDPDEWDLERDYDTTAQSPRNLDHNGDPARGPPVYEAQGDDLQESPDWEVCLNIDAEQEDFGDNAETTGKDRGSESEDIGGQWYDIDDPRVSEYVRENKELINNGDRFNRNDIAYYWRKNHNPLHSYWNPEGGNEGTAVDTNCGNPDHPQISEYECSETDNQDDIDYDIPRIYNFLREAAGFNQNEFNQEVLP